MTTETWLDCKYYNLYEISSLGRVKKYYQDDIVVPFEERYSKEMFCKLEYGSNRTNDVSVSRLICENFHKCNCGVDFIPGYHDGSYTNLKRDNIYCKACREKKLEKILPDLLQDETLITLKRQRDELQVKYDQRIEELTRPRLAKKAKNEITVYITIECPVCKETKNKFTTTKCGHLFCQDCRPLFETNCPTCREEIPKCPMINIL